MKNVFVKGLFVLFLFLLAGAVFAQKPVVGSTKAPRDVETKALPCEQAVAKAQKSLQEQADAECRTVMQCVECMRDKEKTCKSVVAHPVKPTCSGGLKVKVTPKVLNNDPNKSKPGFNVEIFQSQCYGGGVNLEAVVVSDGEASPDGKAQAAAYSYLWEVGSGKGGHSSSVSCVTASTARVQITKIATGETVVREISISSSADKNTALPEELVMAYRKNGCFGTCSAYEVKIYENGTITWEGIANTGTPGKATNRIDDGTLNAIRQNAKNNGFYQLKEQYPDYPVMDAASTTIYANDGSGELEHQVTVSAVADMPGGFAALANQMEELIARYGWKTKTSKGGKPMKQRNTGKSDN